MPAIMAPPAVGRATPTEPMPALGDAEGAKAEAPKAAKSTLVVKSPLVGTYYSAPEPGAKPYVSVGDRIQKGQILCIIEAMKIMNEIESEFSGTLREIAVSDAHPVEYGQVLFRIEPNG
jgi:acetyl-CoA carboxylase biotin carboxyl carrier protein